MYKAKNPQWLNTTLPEKFFFSFYSSFSIHIQIYTQRTEGREKVAYPLYKDSVFLFAMCLNVSSLNFYVETQPHGEGVRRQGLWKVMRSQKQSPLEWDWYP